jgi:hypothetical protein
MGWFSDLVDSFTEAGGNAVDYFTSTEGILDLGSMGLSYLGNQSGIGDAQIPPSGYQGGIPALTAARRQVPVARSGSSQPMSYDPNRRPGSGGRRYFTDVEYVPEEGGIDALAAAEARQDAQAADLMERNMQNPARETRQGMSAGGIASLEKRKGKYLKGDTDGMADEVPAEIEGSQPAALSDGEFVIPADVVSHLGNGNSDAGAKVLERMMARIRKERTGRSEQGKQIKPDRMLPA